MYNTRSLTKYVLLCLLFTASFSAKAQFSTQLGLFRTYNNTNITTKTGAKSITPINVGGNIDSACRYMLWLNSLIGAATGLQGTLNAGNSASTTAGGTSAIVLQDPVTTNAQMTITHSSLQFQTGSSNNILFIPGFSIAQPAMRMYDYTTGNYSALSPGALTGARTFTFPDESGSLVTHTTKDPITIGTSSTGTVITNTYVDIRNSGNTILRLSASSSGTGAVILKDGTSAFSGLIFPSNLSANRGSLIPDEGTGIGLSSTIVLHTTKDDITRLGGSFKTILRDFEIKSQTVAGLDIFKLTNTAGIAQLYMGDGSGTNYTIFQSANALSASVNILGPAHSGTLFTNDHGNSSQVLTGATTMVVTHGLTFAPSGFIPIPKNAAAAAAGTVFINAIGGTTFTINFATPQTGTLSYDWVAY